MPLSPDAIEWLQQRCAANAANDDLEATYAFAHPLNADRRLTKAEVCPVTQKFFIWWTEFVASGNESVLAYPLSRKLYPDHPRASRAGTRATVAFNAVFRVVDKFKGQGFATSVYAAEQQLYSKWNVAEIQLNAIDDGCVVWIKKFGFRPKDPELLREDFPGWARTNKIDPTVPSDPVDYPDAFLRSREQLHLYKVI